MKISIPPFIERMNQREKRLSMIVAAVLFLLLNLFIWSWLFGIASRGRAELAALRAARKQQSVYLKEKKLWATRDQWLQQHQPELKNAAEASALLDQIKQIAGKHNVLIENPAIGSGETTPDHQSVFASIDTKSPWPPLVHFLYDVQQPEAFVVFDSVNIVIDGSDQTVMQGKFKIAKWFAPAQRRK
jgi:hypothetical protein